MMIYNVNFDIAALVVYVIAFVSFFGKKTVKNSQYTALLFLLIFSVLVPGLDIPASIVIDKRCSNFVVYALNTGYYVVKLASTFFFLFFIMSQMELAEKVKRVKKIAISFPLFILLIATFANIKTGWIFSYNDGVWKSGSFRTVNYGLSVLYLVWAFLYVTLNKEVMGHWFKVLIQFLSVANIFAEFFQFFFPNYLIHGFANSLTLLILIMNMERYGMVLDSITGLAKRESLEKIVSKQFFYENLFEVLFVRIKDFDMIINSFGEEKVNLVLRKLEAYFFEVAGMGNVFKVSADTYVLIDTKDCYFSDNLQIIYSTMTRSWKVGGIDYALEFYMVPLYSHENFNDWEILSGYLMYFMGMSRDRGGIVSIDELQVSNKNYENKIERAMEVGMREGTVKVVYQPVCTSAEKNFLMAEALLRLDDPDLGLISPDVFVPIAERSGLILRLGNFVFERTCLFIATHDLDSLGLKYIDVNISTIQCIQENFIKLIEDTISLYGIDPSKICLEITETAAISAPHIFEENLATLSKMGFRLALDDFGSGYGNLHRMITSDFEIVKLDKNMTQRLSSSRELKDVYCTLKTMIQTIGCKVVSEGVETKEQYEFVRDAGCDFIQGYYFSRPLPENEFVDFLKLHNSAFITHTAAPVSDVEELPAEDI